MGTTTPCRSLERDAGPEERAGRPAVVMRTRSIREWFTRGRRSPAGSGSYSARRRAAATSADGSAGAGCSGAHRSISPQRGLLAAQAGDGEAFVATHQRGSRTARPYASRSVETTGISSTSDSTSGSPHAGQHKQQQQSPFAGAKTWQLHQHQYQQPQSPTAKVGYAARASAAAAVAAASAAATQPGSSRHNTTTITSSCSIGSPMSPKMASALLTAPALLSSPRAAAPGHGGGAGATAAAEATASAAGGGGEDGEDRFAELMRRMQQFLPALKAANSIDDDFEATWRLLKGELSALMTSARLSALQAGRLEALDGEVVKLQSLLVLLGKHIKAGAQPHQLCELVKTFPSATQEEIRAAAPGITQQPVAPTAAAPAAAPAAVVAAAAAAATRILEAAGTSAGAATGGRGSGGAQPRCASCTSPVSTRILPAHLAPLSLGKLPGSSGSGLPSPCRDSGAAAQVPEQGQGRGQGQGLPHSMVPWVNPTFGTSSGSHSRRSPEPGAATGAYHYAGEFRDVLGQRAWGSPCGSTPPPACLAGAQGTAAGGGGIATGTGCCRSPSPLRSQTATPLPPTKQLTPDESAKLMALYKVRSEPQRISYKTMRVPGRAGSPHTSPTGKRRSPSPGRGMHVVQQQRQQQQQQQQRGT